MAEDERGTEAQGSESESFGSLFSRLIADGRAFAHAELNLYRSIALDRLAGSRRALLLAAGGLVLMLASVTALLVGFVLALARLIGPLWAGLAIGVGGIIAGCLLLWLATHQFRRMAEMPEEEGL